MRKEEVMTRMGFQGLKIFTENTMIYVYTQEIFSFKKLDLCKSLASMPKIITQHCIVKWSYKKVQFWGFLGLP